MKSAKALAIRTAYPWMVARVRAESHACWSARAGSGSPLLNQLKDTLYPDRERRLKVLPG
jgi:hypothetical protein